MMIAEIRRSRNSCKKVTADRAIKIVVEYGFKGDSVRLAFAWIKTRNLLTPPFKRYHSADLFVG